MKDTNMVEAAATCQRNLFSEIKIAIKCNTNITYSVWWCDAMTKDVRREEMSKFAALPKFIVYHPAWYNTVTVT